MFYLLVLFCAFVVAFFVIQQYKTYQPQPTAEKVRQIVVNFNQRFMIKDNLSESEVEHFLAKALERYFKNVKTQASTQGRERIDIDINHQLGIEVKLSKLLKKTNERNRLLGQMDLYRSRKYTNKPLMTIIAGNQKDLSMPHILEVEKLLKQKNVEVILLPLFEVENK
ncbi:MAG: hypothetical protein EAZ44_07740 [Cytophagia bacterium]|nr:MAG: hypothetical protein EAY69_01765 [Cytophagales bacterium]TAG01993.1 MAG: hypothetical protein EAZ44_07740 [Cytophagia bacterium]TAG42542.1 MAG: hypothetical protein EAZ31_05880 [Cytophagia bacterium]TAH28981.1 MAG: hypothetical protein EAZ06_08275 [Cytophagales bacterium]